MSIPLKEKVVKELEDYLKTDLYQVPRRLKLFNGILKDGSTVIVCTPQSKLNPRGCGCIDLTTVQVSMLDNADHSILVFRVEGNRVYYLNFRNAVGFIFKFYNLIPNLTVTENIEVVANIAMNPLDVDTVLKAVGLETKKRSFPNVQITNTITAAQY